MLATTATLPTLVASRKQIYDSNNNINIPILPTRRTAPLACMRCSSTLTSPKQPCPNLSCSCMVLLLTSHTSCANPSVSGVSECFGQTYVSFILRPAGEVRLSTQINLDPFRSTQINLINLEQISTEQRT